MSAVLTLCAGDLGNPVARGQWVVRAWHLVLLANDLLLRAKCADLARATGFVASRVSLFCLGAAKKIAPPGGALRPGLVPAGWGALGGCPLARFGGGNGPAAGALIGLREGAQLAQRAPQGIG
jgi:hypothetical protein